MKTDIILTGCVKADITFSECMQTDIILIGSLKTESLVDEMLGYEVQYLSFHYGRPVNFPHRYNSRRF